jgi:threonine aldolase
MSPSRIETSTTQDCQDLQSQKQSRDEDALEQLLKDHTESIAWKSAGPAASDFRSKYLSIRVHDKRTN